MRTGLVIVGLVIVVVGAALFLTVVLYPPMQIVSTISTTPFVASAAPQGSSSGHPGVIPDLPRGPVVLVWVANASLGFQFYDAVGCHVFVNNSCIGSPVYSWPANSSGFYAIPGGLTCPCYAIPTNPHPYAVGINGYLAVTHSSLVPSLSTWSYAAVIFGALILLIIGGLALFLGLFLRGHVFRRSRPPGPGESGYELEEGEQEDAEIDGSAPHDGEATDPRTEYWRRGAG